METMQRVNETQGTEHTTLRDSTPNKFTYMFYTFLFYILGIKMIQKYNNKLQTFTFQRYSSFKQ